MDVAIRLASMADYSECNRLGLEVHALHARNESWLFRMPDDGRLWSRKEFAEMVEGTVSAVLLAEVGGEAVGFAHVKLIFDPNLPTHAPRLACSVDVLGVTEAWQRRGVGLRLMDAAEAWGRERRADELTLSVHAFNRPALEFYRRLGFETYLLRMRRPLTPKDPPEG